MVAARFLRNFIAILPRRIHTILADNGVQFTNRKQDTTAFEHGNIRMGRPKAPAAAQSRLECEFQTATIMLLPIVATRQESYPYHPFNKRVFRAVRLIWVFALALLYPAEGWALKWTFIKICKSGPEQVLLSVTEPGGLLSASKSYGWHDFDRDGCYETSLLSGERLGFTFVSFRSEHEMIPLKFDVRGATKGYTDNICVPLSAYSRRTWESTNQSCGKNSVAVPASFLIKGGSREEQINITIPSQGIQGLPASSEWAKKYAIRYGRPEIQAPDEGSVPDAPDEGSWDAIIRRAIIRGLIGAAAPTGDQKSTGPADTAKDKEITEPEEEFVLTNSGCRPVEEVFVIDVTGRRTGIRRGFLSSVPVSCDPKRFGTRPMNYLPREYYDMKDCKIRSDSRNKLIYARTPEVFSQVKEQIEHGLAFCRNAKDNNQVFIPPIRLAPRVMPSVDNDQGLSP